MSTLKADTIQNTTGGPVTLTNQSAAKAWVNFDTDAVINESFNGSSITDITTGQFKYTVTNAMNTTTYCQSTSSGATKHTSGWEAARTTSVCGILTFANTHVYGDYTDGNILMHGDLA